MSGACGTVGQVCKAVSLFLLTSIALLTTTLVGV